MSTRKHKNDRFNLLHGALDKNIKKNASRTIWSKEKKLIKKLKPKKVAGEIVKAAKLKAKEIKRKKYENHNIKK